MSLLFLHEADRKAHLATLMLFQASLPKSIQLDRGSATNLPVLGQRYERFRRRPLQISAAAARDFE